MHREKCEKNAQNMQKMMQKCKKVRNANALQKWNQIGAFGCKIGL
jgi:hypothetical protein